jgi:hypothetical protein
MSLELMLYASLAGLSFAFALAAVAKESSGIATGTATFEASQVVDSLNGAVLSGNTGRFDVFVPQGMCNSTTSGEGLFYRGSWLYFAEPLSFHDRPFCPDGTDAILEIGYNLTGPYLVRFR